MGLIGNFVARRVESAYLADAEKFLTVVRSYGKRELAQMRVCSMIAFAYMMTESAAGDDDGVLRIAVQAIHEETAISDRESGMLSGYLLKLLRTQEAAQRSQNEITRAIAAGIPLWVTSFRAAMKVAVLPHAREAWHLMRNKGDWDWATDELARIADRMQGNPIQPFLLRSYSMEIPGLFVAK